MIIVYTFFIKLPLIALVAHASRLRALAAPARACARKRLRLPIAAWDQRRDIPKRSSLGPFSRAERFPDGGASPSPLKISMTRASCF